MNTFMVLRQRAPITLRTESNRMYGIVRRTQAGITRRYWRLRPAGAALCDVDLPAIHATLFVAPQQIALESMLRNEAGLARYYAARYTYRKQALTDHFENTVMPSTDHVCGPGRRATIRPSAVKLARTSGNQRPDQRRGRLSAAQGATVTSEAGAEQAMRSRHIA
ncbi:MAG TPA: hypothetical protein VFQ88_02185 [Nevskiaceae bacterium]|nr:hypothetical protein [Nevskiaceae bacterium]